MKKYIIVSITILATAFVASTLLLNKPTTLAIDNIIQPTSEETLMNFDCSELPCEILGSKTNNQGVELRLTEYELIIKNTQINNLNNVGFIVNKGDKLFFSATDQDKSNYFMFLPRLDVSHQFIQGQNPSLILETEGIPRGDYQIVLQDSLNPKTANTNFTAGVLRIE